MTILLLWRQQNYKNMETEYVQENITLDENQQIYIF